MSDKKYCAEHELTYVSECFYCAALPTNAAMAEASRAKIREQEYVKSELERELASARLKYDLLFIASKARITELESQLVRALEESK